MSTILPPLPANERTRLQEVYRYGILDSGSEPSFDLIVQMAQETIGTSASLFSVVDENRQWFKARIGIADAETPRELSICSYTICHEDYFEIEDTQTDERFAGNSLIRRLGIRAYLGVPVYSRAGLPLGSLCVMDREPRRFSEQNRRFLHHLSRLLTDELELRLSEQKLERALLDVEKFEAARRQFLAMISHECRTPLVAIKGALDILGSQERNEQQSGFIRMAQDASDRLTRMINDVITTAMIDYGAMEITREWFDPAELATQVAANFRYKAAAKNIAIDLSCAPHLPTVIYADRTKLLQIFNHLMSNAVKFTDAGCIQMNVTISRQNFLSVEIIDTGSGFPEEKAKTLFQAFTQNEHYLNRRHEGLGLGLPICAELCRLMGGKLIAKALPGVGSRVCFEIPVSGDVSGDGSGKAGPKAQKTDFTPISLGDLIRDRR